jgi:hypothetical protein
VKLMEPTKEAGPGPGVRSIDTRRTPGPGPDLFMIR